MPASDVRSVKRRMTSRPKPSSALLVIRDVRFEAAPPWHRNEALMAPLLESLDTFLSGPIDVKEVRARRPTEAGDWRTVGAALRQSGSGSYEITATALGGRAAITLDLTDVSFTLDVQVPLADTNQAKVRSLLDGLLEVVHENYCTIALVGPSLSVRLLNVPYPRHRPFREHPHWPAGAVTLAACRRFFASRGPLRIARFEVLETSPLPPVLSRRMSGDLLVIETKSADLSNLGEARASLEKWIGDAMQLTIDEDFDKRGDRRLVVWDRQPAGSLGFYDSAARVLYKSAPEIENDNLDPETLALLEQVLATSELPEHGPVLGKRILFVGRPAAVRWSPWVEERGGKVAYLGEDGEIWEPASAETK